jgi:hypothetical protein
MKNTLRIVAFGMVFLAPVVALAQAVPPYVPPAAEAPQAAPIPGLGGIGANGYRTDVPGVLTRQPRPGAPAAIDRNTTVATYRAAYTAQNRPRIVVYWFRQLGELAGQDCAIEVISRDNRQASGSAAGELGVLGRAQIDAQASRSGESSNCVVIGRRAGTGGQAGATPDEFFGAGFEAAFTNAMLDASTRMIDRNTIIRTTAAANPQRTGSAQNIETAALLGKAELLMEVVMLEDPRSPTRKSFRVAIKDVASGEIVATLVTRAIPPELLRRRYEARDGSLVRGQREQLDAVAEDDDIENANGWVIVPGGTIERGNRQVSVSTLANRLALETMQRLAQRWGSSGGS